MKRLVSIFGAVALILIAALPVAAAKPTTSVETIEESGIDAGASADCGFPVAYTLTGRARTKSWVDADGIERVIFTVSVRAEYTANGRTVRGVDAGMDMGFFQPDGTAKIAIHGSVGLTTVPGSGPVLGSAGRLVLLFTPVLDEDGNPVLDPDGNPMFDVEVLAESGVVGSGDTAAFCEYLAG